MKRILIALSLIPTFAFADKIEVTGQFVIAPISSNTCEAVGILTPTAELPSDSKLLDMLTYFMDEDDNTTGIQRAEAEKHIDDKALKYSVNGQRLTELKQGINIVVDAEGKTRKFIL